MPVWPVAGGARAPYPGRAGRLRRGAGAEARRDVPSRVARSKSLWWSRSPSARAKRCECLPGTGPWGRRITGDRGHARRSPAFRVVLLFRSIFVHRFRPGV